MKLPSAIIIGAQKCATTGLIYSLDQHPDIWCAHEMNYKKAKMPPPGNGGSELSFFCNHWDEGVEWYSNWFTPGKDKFCIEKSPDYFMCPDSAIRIKQTVPDCKLILMVREPVKRAFSAYNHIQQEKAEWAKEAVDVPFLEATEKYPPLLGEGRYYDNLENWLRFFPEEQILVVIQERLLTQHEVEHTRIFKFLNLPIFPISNYESHVRSYDGRKILPEEMTRLKYYYQSHNEKLFKFLGYRIEEWN